MPCSIEPKMGNHLINWKFTEKVHKPSKGSMIKQSYLEDIGLKSLIIKPPVAIPLSVEH